MDTATDKAFPGNVVSNGTWQSRVRKERDDLRDKLIALAGFIGHDSFLQLSERQQHLLHAQQRTMQEYMQILQMRLGADAELERSEPAS